MAFFAYTFGQYDNMSDHGVNLHGTWFRMPWPGNLGGPCAI